MTQVQIKDVARRAGVSSATVSRVINGESGVSPERRGRVEEAIRELGYKPNRLARSLRRNVSDSIGVVISDIENPHFTRAVRVIEGAAFNQGFRVLLCNTDETLEKQRVYLEMLAAERVLGVIVATADPHDPTLGHVIDLGIPVVAFDREIADPRADAVIADNIAAGRKATEFLHSRGHTSIGFISGRSEIQTGADRRAGYEAASRDLGTKVITRSGNFRIDDAADATRTILREHPEITALIVGNNLMTVGALNALRSENLDVPNDISLVQLDDPFWANLLSPPLTSFGQPVREMAEMSIALLLQRVREQRQLARHVVFHFELKERKSVKWINAPTS